MEKIQIVSAPTPTLEQLEQLFDRDCPDTILLEEMVKSLGFKDLNDWLLCRFEK